MKEMLLVTGKLLLANSIASENGKADRQANRQANISGHDRGSERCKSHRHYHDHRWTTKNPRVSYPAKGIGEAILSSPLIFQYTLPELAPSRRFGGCRSFKGPVPPLLWIRVLNYAIEARMITPMVPGVNRRSIERCHQAISTLRVLIVTLF